MPYRQLDIKPGHRFGKLTVICEEEGIPTPSGKTVRAFRCSCECGNEKVVRLLHLNHGRVVSCGCLWRTQRGKSTSRVYKAWAAMKVRCSPKHVDAHLYYEKGVRICDDWKDFEVFEEWAVNAGFKPGLTLDRIDGNRGYEPSNCRWVTPQQNSNNRSVTLMVDYRGTRRPIMEVLDELGMRSHRSAITARMNRGWSTEQAIDTPIRKGNYLIKQMEPSKFKTTNP